MWTPPCPHTPSPKWKGICPSSQEERGRDRGHAGANGVIDGSNARLARTSQQRYAQQKRRPDMLDDVRPSRLQSNKPWLSSASFVNACGCLPRARPATIAPPPVDGRLNASVSPSGDYATKLSMVWVIGMMAVMTLQTKSAHHDCWACLVFRQSEPKLISCYLSSV